MITFRKGKKSPTDKIFAWFGHEFTNKELLEITLEILKNEDGNLE